MVDVVEFLTGGHTVSHGHANIVVCDSQNPAEVVSSQMLLEAHTFEALDNKGHILTAQSSPSRSNLEASQVTRRIAFHRLWSRRVLPSRLKSGVVEPSIEAFGAQQEDIGVRGEGHDGDAPAEAMDSPAMRCRNPFSSSC